MVKKNKNIFDSDYDFKSVSVPQIIFFVLKNSQNGFFIIAQSFDVRIIPIVKYNISFKMSRPALTSDIVLSSDPLV